LSYKHLFYITAAGYAPLGICEQYMSVDEAKKSMFTAADEFVPSNVELTDKMRDAIKDKSGVRVADKNLTLIKAYSKKKFIGYLIVDKVVGKHEFITYAVSISPELAVSSVEILEYRETYGFEVRRAAWRDQFVGKNSKSELKLDKDIKNIAGATLSSRHVTDGVRRLLHTLEVIGVRENG